MSSSTQWWLSDNFRLSAKTVENEREICLNCHFLEEESSVIQCNKSVKLLPPNLYFFSIAKGENERDRSHSVGGKKISV